MPPSVCLFEGIQVLVSVVKTCHSFSVYPEAKKIFLSSIVFTLSPYPTPEEMISLPPGSCLFQKSLQILGEGKKNHKTKKPKHHPYKQIPYVFRGCLKPLQKRLSIFSCQPLEKLLSSLRPQVQRFQPQKTKLSLFLFSYFIYLRKSQISHSKNNQKHKWMHTCS